MNIPRSSLEQDDVVNSLNYEGIAVIELQFYHFPDSDRLRVGSYQDSMTGTVNDYGDHDRYKINH